MQNLTDASLGVLLQVDLVKVYLSSEVFNLKQAVHVSDRTLSSIEKAETNYEGLMRVWDKYKNDGRVNTMLERKQPRPPGPKTVIFSTFSGSRIIAASGWQSTT